jgi:hypothetical protein
LNSRLPAQGLSSVIVQRLMKENDVLAIADGRPPADVAGGM